VGKVFLAFGAQLSAMMMGNTYAMTLARAMTVAAWGDVFHMADGALQNGLTADPMPPDAARVQERKRADGEAGNDSRFSATIGEGQGATASSIPVPKPPYTEWPTDMKKLEEKEGKPVCPCCGNRSKRNGFALGRIHDLLTEVAACSNCRTTYSNAAAKAKKEQEAAAAAIAQAKADEARFAEVKKEITALEAETLAAEKESGAYDAMLKANPDSAIAKATKKAADDVLDDLATRYSALVDECKGLEAKLSGSSNSKTHPVQVQPKPGSVLGNLAAAEQKAKGKK
jgi:hypothetical protein